jgi:hypothetical protein
VQQAFGLLRGGRRTGWRIDCGQGDCSLDLPAAARLLEASVDEVVFGRYRLIALIGEGGMSKVYKAYDSQIGRDVAIKVLLTDLSAEPGYRERFRREAHTAARLTEPHIIPIFRHRGSRRSAVFGDAGCRRGRPTWFAGA